MIKRSFLHELISSPQAEYFNCYIIWHWEVEITNKQKSSTCFLSVGQTVSRCCSPVQLGVMLSRDINVSWLHDNTNIARSCTELNKEPRICTIKGWISRVGETPGRKISCGLWIITQGILYFLPVVPFWGGPHPSWLGLTRGGIHPGSHSQSHLLSF